MTETELPIPAISTWQMYGLITLTALAVITIVSTIAIGVLGTFFSHISHFPSVIGTIGYEGSLTFLIGGSFAIAVLATYFLQAVV